MTENKTMEKENEIVEALIVYKGMIIYAGSLAEAEKISVKKKIDLQGRCVIPGFNDTHCHLAEVAENKKRVNVEQAKKI